MYFFPKNINTPLRLSSAKSIISEFKKTARHEESVLDLQLYYVEQGNAYTLEYGDINEQFYISLVAMFKSFVSGTMKLDNGEFMNSIYDRIRKVYFDAQPIGWGYSDEISFLYKEL